MQRRRVPDILLKPCQRKNPNSITYSRFRHTPFCCPLEGKPDLFKERILKSNCSFRALISREKLFEVFN
jgi:hypothetical protein